MKPWIGGVEVEGPLARLAFFRIVVGGYAAVSESNLSQLS